MSELNKRFLTSVLLLLILFLSFMDTKILYVILIIINFLVIDEFIKMFKKIFNINSFSYFLAIISMIIYLCYFTLVIIFFLTQSFEINKFKILFILSICISTDIGGYIFGRTIGGKKITKISPNKTYSGLVGSFVISLIIGYSFQNAYDDIILPDTNLFLVIMLISSISQAGDLIISIFKRKAKIKDTGSFLPGHGGILDRIDGVLLALPVGILIISI